MMNFIGKLEALINGFILRTWAMFLALLWKAVPSKIKDLIATYSPRMSELKPFLKTLPKLIVEWIIVHVKALKSRLMTMDYKSNFLKAYDGALSQYKVKTPEGFQKLKVIATAPFIMIGHWLQGLSTAQSCLLMLFTAFSFLSVISMVFSGHRIAVTSMDNDGRSPASISPLDDVTYERPIYYKKESKYLEVTAFRLPVYFAKVNEVHSVDIDFVITMSSRESKKALAKKEFLLRDHLILNIEPSVATFPLEQEGKEIIREKLLMEMNVFMRENGIEGAVTNVELTYVLAN